MAVPHAGTTDPKILSPSAFVSVPPTPTHTNRPEAQTVVCLPPSGNRISRKFVAQGLRPGRGQVQR